MAKPNPKRWFPSNFTARISLRKVDRYAEAQKAYKPYFETWDEAHAHMLADAKRELDRARVSFKSAERRLKNVAELLTPNDGLSGRNEAPAK